MSSGFLIQITVLSIRGSQPLITLWSKAGTRSQLNITSHDKFKFTVVMLQLSLVSSIPLVFKNPFCDCASEGTLTSSLVNEMTRSDLRFLLV